jgi:hypothetical protein
MNKERFEEMEIERVRKALPKSKALTNNVWTSRGGNATPIPMSPGCHSLVCQKNAPTPA